jgi:lipoprotein-releasing system ATP-binding protein
MPSPAPLLKLAGVTKQFESPDHPQGLAILKDISLEIAAGESLAIVGPSGSGKSTLLHIMGTLDAPTRGSVSLAGQDLAGLKDAALAAVRNRQVGFVFQAHYLLPQCSAIENVLVPALACDDPAVREGAEARAEQLLKRVGLGERVNHRPGELSGGEKQRVAVVRALINQPRLVLADEPTGALDHESAVGLFQLLIELNREEGTALVVVTHALDLARQLGRVLTLKDGQLTRQA